ncbi:MAG TPA: NnrS family protein [Burkholderiaceae bacterium]|nr:NnrS family protein [Burkholderiaceae bacterium]
MQFLHTIEEPPARSQRFALWELGFRPFYLAGSTFAALSIALWMLQVSGVLPAAYLAGPLWHAHEMLFGFALAVIVGFLFTAGRNWTNEPTPTGRTLAALVLLWLAARVLVLTPWGWPAAVANVAFPIAAASCLAGPFIKARNRRNYFFVGLLVALGIAAGVIHLAQLGVIAVPAWAGLQVALDAVMFIVAVMGGRVIPMFTNGGIPGAGAVRNITVERVALGSVLVLIAADLVGTHGGWLVACAVVGCIAHAVRWALWRPWRTASTPIVWVLHLAYAWLPIHLGLRALAELGRVPASTATHALTVGAIGGLIIGMMTRTARGHTARPLRADRFDVACYGLVLLAGAIRVGAPLLWPALSLVAWQLSAVSWSAGFGLYAIRYWPVLTRARLDGKPG